MMRLLAAAIATLLLPTVPRAHEVLHEVVHEVEHGRATAVRAFFADGEPLANATADVYSPADPAVPHQAGRTDRNGWLAFVPDVPGAWRVKIVDGSGHGLETSVQIAPAPTAGAGAPSAAASLSPVAFVLRPLVGVAVLGAVFAALFVVRRRKGSARRSP
jgi:nickel transport protein